MGSDHAALGAAGDATDRALRRRFAALVANLILAVALPIVGFAILLGGSNVYASAALVVLIVMSLVGSFIGPHVPIQAVRPLLRRRVVTRATVLPTPTTADRPGPASSFHLRIGDHDYAWQAALPSGCVPYVGGTLELRGDVRDRGWVLAYDPTWGAAYPLKRLRLMA
ncbi:hypothetical protein FE697_007080 [Mumia zhuanghuii]|uniref:DUF5808 domain-containing protein n=2 Tax=Mumia TaxID=1546255 RepID=A0ABW1QLD5_9ACTN|nr:MULTISPECIES: hypothetical protein [Mumia]KAA1423369.1 hypothetical protein FE697_007080 [Mumia zhuanghuii]